MMSDFRITEAGSITNGIATLDAPAPDRVVELELQIERLTGEAAVSRTRIEALNREVQTARRNHHADIDVIGEALTEEAKNRSWCEEYRNFIAKVNSRLSVELPLLEQDFEVEVTETVTVVLRRTITVSATDGDAAQETAQETFESDWDESDFRQSYRNGDYEVTDTEFEVQ